MSQQSLFAESYPHTPAQNEIMSSLENQGYAPLPFSIGKTACSELFADFRAFVNLCNETDGEQLKQALCYSVNDKGDGDFYMDYRIPGAINPHETGDRAPGKDHKYTYHHGVSSSQRAKDSLGGSLPAEMSVFLECCDDMYEAARKSAKLGAQALGLEGIFFSGYRGDDVIHLRLIDYVASDEPLLGEAHFDRAVATLAISESDTGLRGVPGQNGHLKPVSEEYIENLRSGLTPIEHFEHEAKFFLAAGANRLSTPNRTSIAHLPLLGHDITNDRPGASRQSVVMFINPHNRFPNYSVPTKHETGFDDIITQIRRREAAA